MFFKEAQRLEIFFRIKNESAAFHPFKRIPFLKKGGKNMVQVSRETDNYTINGGPLEG